jgi:electron transfer flavoprotein alpha/beta subunit
MKAKKKPLEVLKPADLGVDVAPRTDAARGRTAEAQGRHQGGRRGRSGREAQNEAKVI